NARNQQKRQHDASGTLAIEETVRRAEPAERWNDVKAVEAEVGGVLREQAHRAFDRSDALRAEQPRDLRPKRAESDKINHPQQPEEQPADQEVSRTLNLPAPEKSREDGEQAAVPGDDVVGDLTGWRGARHVAINP